MLYYNIIISAILSALFILFLWNIFILRKKRYPSIKDSNLPFISVLIPARNEEINIRTVVMSLLNRNSKVSAMLKKGNEQYSENVEWDGKDPEYLVMKKVSKSVDVKKGDTVVTSNYSPSFPSLLMIGVVTEIRTDAQGDTYALKIKATTNFTTLQYVNVILNHYYEEQNKLDSLTRKLQFNTGNE